MVRQEQNKDYWEERIKQEQAYMQRATDVGALGEHFERAIDDIQQKIDHEYARLEKLGFNKNMVEDADIKAYEREAKQLVKEADNIRASLGRNAKKSDFTQAVNDRMTIYNATMRINRLEYLKSETALSLTKAGVNTVGDMQKELTKKYMNERKRQSGILGETIRPASADKVFKQVMAQIDGATFSDRIWRNTDELKVQLDVLLTNNQIQGHNPKVIVQRLRSFVSEQFADKAKYVTERIARTESTRMIGAAQLDSYREAGLEYTKWIAEASACDFCEDIAHGGKNGEGVYKLDKVPMYPKHANCRCSLAGYYNPDEDVKKTTAKKETNETSFEQFDTSMVSDDISKFTNDSKFKGLKDDVIEIVSKALSKNFNNMNLPKLSGVEAITERSKMGKLVFPNGGAASYSHAGNKLYLNSTQIGTLKKLETINKETDEAIEALRNNVDKLSGDKKKQAELALKSGRGNVDGSLDGIITHELGHQIHFKELISKNDELNSELIKTWKNYADNISYYATSSYPEYIAESYTAYTKGEIDILDPKLVDYFNSLRKKKH